MKINFTALSRFINADEDAIYVPKSLLLKKPAIVFEHPANLLNDDGLPYQFSHLKMIDFIQQTIKSLLATGECNKNNIALCVGSHPKKLQRLLAENNMSYREIMEQVRKERGHQITSATTVITDDDSLKAGV